MQNKCIILGMIHFHPLDHFSNKRRNRMKMMLASSTLLSTPQISNLTMEYGLQMVLFLVLGLCLCCVVKSLASKGTKIRSRITESLLDSCCPRRRARWAQCRKRCEKRCEKQTPHEECCLAKCAMNLFKTHLPPPLPLKAKNKKKDKATKCTPTATQSTKSQESSNGQESTIETPVAGRPTMPLIDMARMQYWKKIIEHANRGGQRDSDGLMPLHWACSAGPPIECVQALIDVYPSAARKKDREGSGSLPLHFASHYSASSAVIDAVLKVYPQAASMQDRYGRTPLYHAVEKSLGIDVLSMLLRTDPSTATVPCLPNDR